MKATIGSHGRKDISVAIENSLIEDVLAGRLTVMSKSRDGYFDNPDYPANDPATGEPFNNNETGGDTVGDLDGLFVRPVLKWTPTENLDVTLLAEFGDLKDGGATARPYEFRGIVDEDGNIDRYPPFDTSHIGNQELAHNTKGDSSTEWQPSDDMMGYGQFTSPLGAVGLI